MPTKDQVRGYLRNALNIKEFKDYEPSDQSLFNRLDANNKNKSVIQLMEDKYNLVLDAGKFNKRIERRQIELLNALSEEKKKIPEYQKRGEDFQKEYNSITETDDKSIQRKSELAILMYENNALISSLKSGCESFETSHYKYNFSLHEDLEFGRIVRESGVAEKEINDLDKYIKMRENLCRSYDDIPLENKKDAFRIYKQAEEDYSKLSGWQQFWAHILPSAIYKPAELLACKNVCEEELKKAGFTQEKFDDMIAVTSDYDDGYVVDNGDIETEELDKDLEPEKKDVRLSDINKDFGKEFSTITITTDAKEQPVQEQPTKELGQN